MHGVSPLGFDALEEEEEVSPLSAANWGQLGFMCPFSPQWWHVSFACEARELELEAEDALEEAREPFFLPFPLPLPSLPSLPFAFSFEGGLGP